MSASAQTRVLVLLLCSAGSAAGQLQQSAEELLAEVAQRYGQAENFHFEATETTSTKSGDLQREQTLRLVTVRDKAGRWRVETGGSVDSMLAVFDGLLQWTYRATAGTYSKRRPGAASGELGNGSPLGAFQDSFISRYGGLTDRMKTARLLEEKPLAVEGGSVRCQLIEAEYAPPAGSAAATLRRTFWIEQDRSLIWREESEASMDQPGTDMVVVRQTVSFRIARVDERLSDDLFSFIPPAGARLVESFNGDPEQHAEIDGQPAPAFHVSDLQGNPVRLDALRGKVVLLNFWATWCVPCRIELPRLEELHRSRGAEGLVVLGVNSESREIAAEFVQQHAYTFPTLADSERSVARAYRVHSIPTTVGIGRDGNIAFYLVGAQSESDLQAALAEAGLGPAVP